MDTFYIDIDGFWLKDAYTNGPESAPVADEQYAGLELGRRLSRESNSGLEPASVML